MFASRCMSGSVDVLRVVFVLARNMKSDGSKIVRQSVLIFVWQPVHHPTDFLDMPKA